MMAAAPSTSTSGSGTRRGDSGSWFEALSEAWGNTLDQEAGRISQMSDAIGVDGNDNPSDISKLTAESLRMGFMSQSESSSVDSVGKALETMARKD
ncbi:hypothetical protein HZF05_08810 [Sphingomonas sp. CGMCC 1.13654]|uniref:Uncharacterized protein n=2 Tax=Sphingomonas chungangi TaxID=2683589 RepID=A0A838L5J9_9SPHN|nr:hypothetical protein [Sphingomonas chungangi]